MQSLFLPRMSITIYAKDLVKKYGSRTVVNHVSFDVKQGEIVGLLGPNGAGKTTSFYQVVGLVRPDEGSVYLDDENITPLAMYKRAQLGIGYLPQEASIFRKLSVEDNIAAVLEMTKLSKQQQRDKLESLLDEFRLHHVRKSNGDVLSGGERRRTEIARALAVDPKFILLDEPFAGIDPIAVEDIQAIVARLKYKNIGILITDHNVTETLSICDRAYLLIEGKIFKHGTAEELAEDEQVRKLYLGRDFVLKRKDWLHEEARTARRNDDDNKSMAGLLQTLEDQVIELKTLSSSYLDQRLIDFNFFKNLEIVLTLAQDHANHQQVPKLSQYVTEIRAIGLEKKLYRGFSIIDNMEQIIFPDESSSYDNSLRTETLFKEELQRVSELLDKIRLIYGNPAFAEVLH